ncbi:unnamed protein product [Phyllotreta striolata]|uniref:Uncharacterized protein n=1 Tax=Phyllotreta striolata TaxID=444603 RepID=A0A9N9TLY2_PHYSR|nr:unnamed protein product [Phyllotreta striolata]
MFGNKYFQDSPPSTVLDDKLGEKTSRTGKSSARAPHGEVRNARTPRIRLFAAAVKGSLELESAKTTVRANGCARVEPPLYPEDAWPVAALPRQERRDSCGATGLRRNFPRWYWWVWCGIRATAGIEFVAFQTRSIPNYAIQTKCKICL